MFANSLLILFSSNSLALAFLKSAMNWTNPRMFALFPDEPRLKKPPVDVAMIGVDLCLYRNKNSADLSKGVMICI
jgi:hypothetical protein